MENIRKRVNVKLINNETQLKKAIAKPTCEYFTKINDDLAMVQLTRKKITQNKPLYTGFVVLELSKLLMYDFHYNYIQERYGVDKARLLFTDTDSLCYKIETDDLYQDMMENIQYYDTSSYPKTHPLYSPTNAKVIGKFKDETNSVPPEEFVGLRAKMYSLKCEYPKMTAKGIKKGHVTRHVRHSAFVEVLLLGKDWLVLFLVCLLLLRWNSPVVRVEGDLGQPPSCGLSWRALLPILSKHHQK